MTTLSAGWDILGEGGSHTLYAVVDPSGQVTEFDESDNTASAEITLPRFTLSLATAQATYTMGDPVTTTVSITNLTSSNVENVLITTTIAYVGWLETFNDVRSLTVTALTAENFAVMWDTPIYTGTYFIRAAATDQNGEYAETSIPIEMVAAVVTGTPEVNIGLDRGVTAGDVITFTGTITDSDTPSGHTLLWDLGDGTVATNTLTVTHTYATYGQYTVTLAVTDTDGLSDTDSLIVMVTEDCLAVGTLITFTGTYTDPGFLDTHVLTWTLGDGTTLTNQLTVTHAYTAPGVYTVTLSVRDDDGGVGSDTLTITVGCSTARVIMQQDMWANVKGTPTWEEAPYSTGNIAGLYMVYAGCHPPAGYNGERLMFHRRRGDLGAQLTVV